MADPSTFYVGTYTSRSPLGQRSEGIYRFELEGRMAALTPHGRAAAMPNPTWVGCHPTLPVVYAVMELREDGRRSGGAVVAFARDRQTGALTRLGETLTRGAGPCHLSLVGGGRLLLVANYASGSLTVMAVGGDGELGPVTQVIQHAGAGPVVGRQEGPHAHCVIPDPTGRFALAADLGSDQVLIYAIDVAGQQLSPAGKLSLPPGTGPRHLAFHPNGRWLYLTGELDSTVRFCAWDAVAGRLAARQVSSLLPPGWAGENTAAEILVDRLGRFVYASNRGHDSIVICAVDGATGELTALGHQSTQGRTPRHFALDPSGLFMVVANQDSDNLVVLAVDPATGGLTPTGQAASVPMPVCVRFG